MKLINFHLPKYISIKCSYKMTILMLLMAPRVKGDAKLGVTWLMLQRRQLRWHAVALREAEANQVLTNLTGVLG